MEQSSVAPLTTKPSTCVELSLLGLFELLLVLSLAITKLLLLSSANIQLPMEELLYMSATPPRLLLELVLLVLLELVEELDELELLDVLEVLLVELVLLGELRLLVELVLLVLELDVLLVELELDVLLVELGLLAELVLLVLEELLEELELEDRYSHAPAYTWPGRPAPETATQPSSGG